MLNYSNCMKNMVQCALDLGETMYDPAGTPYYVRYLVTQDLINPLGSAAVANVWYPMGMCWNNVVTMLPYWGHQDEDSGDGTEGVWIAANELRARAAAILGCDPPTD